VDTRTGMILPQDDIPSGQIKYFVPVVRDLTAKEIAQHQIELYSPCACGSGKKLKHCCWRKQRGFADLIVVILAGAVILGAGLILEGIRTVTEDELPDGWSYPISIYSEVE
jgi:hypothetical protein